MRHSRVTRLYLPNGGSTFAGRLAYGLGYQSQRGAWTERAWAVIRKVNARLGEPEAQRLDYPPKPKWMRWRTFNRLCAKRDAAEATLDADLVADGERILSHGPDPQFGPPSTHRQACAKQAFSRSPFPGAIATRYQNLGELIRTDGPRRPQSKEQDAGRVERHACRKVNDIVPADHDRRHQSKRR